MLLGKLGRAARLQPVLVLIAVLVAAPLIAEDFTVIVLPDTQFYSKDFPEIFTAQTRWIADNVSALNIKFVIGEGDIVNGGGFPVQWQNADAAVRLLDGKVPYFMAIGNHDYNSPAAIPSQNVVLKPGSPPEPPCRLNVTDPSVTICMPADGAVLTSPVRIVAGTTSLYPVTGMHIYVDGISQFTTKANVLDATLPLAAGSRRLTAQAFDSKGAVFKQTIFVAVSDAAVSLLPSSINFGSQVVGTTSSAKSLTLANRTEADLQITEVTATGDFSIASTNCGTTLAPAASCQVDMVFAPTIVGSRSGTLQVTSSDAASPHVATLTGSGASASPPVCTPGAVQPSVTICTPQNGATATSPVHIVAVTNSANPVGLIQIYVDGIKATERLSTSIDVELPIAAGARRVTVQAKDSTGVMFKQTINITVQ